MRIAPSLERMVARCPFCRVLRRSWSLFLPLFLLIAGLVGPAARAAGESVAVFAPAPRFPGALARHGQGCPPRRGAGRQAGGSAADRRKRTAGVPRGTGCGRPAARLRPLVLVGRRFERPVHRLRPRVRPHLLAGALRTTLPRPGRCGSRLARHRAAPGAAAGRRGRGGSRGLLPRWQHDRFEEVAQKIRALAAGSRRRRSGFDDFRLPQVGREGLVSFLDVAGRENTMVAFLHTGCLPCARQLEVLDFARDRHAGRVNLVTVFLDDAADSRIRGFLGAAGVTPDYILRDHEMRFAGRYGIDSVPALLVIDADGRIVLSRSGYREEDRDGLYRDLELAFADGARLPRPPIRPSGRPAAFMGSLLVPARGEAGVRPALPGADSRDCCRATPPSTCASPKPRSPPAAGTLRSAAWPVTSPPSPRPTTVRTSGRRSPACSLRSPDRRRQRRSSVAPAARARDGVA